MQVISQIVEGHVLNQVISLPKALQETKVKITVEPIFENKPKKTTREMLRKSLKGSNTEALTGVLKDISSID
jgi:F0F1-type ATP synthase delta subunit